MMASLLYLQQARHTIPWSACSSHSFCLENFPWSLHGWFLVSDEVLIQVLKEAFLDPLFKGPVPSPTPVTFYHITFFNCLHSSLLSSQNDLFSSCSSASESPYMLFTLPGILLPFFSCGCFSTFRSELKSYLFRKDFPDHPLPHYH